MSTPSPSDAGSSPFRRSGGDLLVDVRLTPRAAVDAIDGPATLSDGRRVLQARVRAIPEGGKANAALERLIAGAAGLPKSAATIVSGATARLKTVRLAGADGGAEAALLAAGRR